MKGKEARGGGKTRGKWRKKGTQKMIAHYYHTDFINTTLQI